MEMINQTPGPWSVGELTTRSLEGFKVKAYSISAHGTAIACVFAGSVGGNRILPNIEGLPNAKIIAAAPELAEALLAFRPMMADGCDCIYSNEPEDTKRCPCKMMHAALAKAGL